MDKIDVAIIGGGVIGLAVASAIARDEKDIFIFEKNDSFGQEASSRNSEVIHSGIYYPRDSLKTKTCLEGNRLLYEICQQHNIPHKKTGKLIVAKNSSEIDSLEVLFTQGVENGIEGIKMLNKDEIKGLEPHIKAYQAIFLPTSGIIDSHSLMEYFLSKAKAHGSDIIYSSEIIGIDMIKDEYKIAVRSKMQNTYTFTSKIVINCAGLNSDTVANMAGIRNDDYVLSYCKGDYFRLGNKKNLLIRGLVYPVCTPDDSSLGIHVTPDLTGAVRLGPDAEYLDSREIDYSVDPCKRDIFYKSVKTFLPFLEEEDISSDTSGIRSKLQGPGENFRDFVIKHEIDTGLRGFINLIGIESPGLTASPSIAEMVDEMVNELI